MLCEMLQRCWKHRVGSSTLVAAPGHVRETASASVIDCCLRVIPEALYLASNDLGHELSTSCGPAKAGMRRTAAALLKRAQNPSAPASYRAAWKVE